MKIYVVCDLEGVAGVIDHHQQCSWDAAKGWYAPYLAQARRVDAVTVAIDQADAPWLLI